MSKKQSQKEYEQWCQQAGNVFTDEMAKGAFVFQPGAPSTAAHNNKKSKLYERNHGQLRISGRVYRY